MAVSTNDCGCCVNVLAQAGAVVNVGCCGDGTNADGSTTNADGSTTNADGSMNSPNGLIRNAIATCYNGNLSLDWETPVTGLNNVDVLADGDAQESANTTGNYTINNSTGEGVLRLQITGTDEFVDVPYSACEQPTPTAYSLNAQCAGSQIQLNWNNPDGVNLYLYRTTDNTLVTQSSSVFLFNDIAPISGVNDYTLSDTPLPTLNVLDTATIDATSCQVACGSPIPIVSNAYEIIKDSADAGAYTGAGLTTDIIFPCTGIGGCLEPTYFLLTGIRLYKEGVAEPIPSGNYTWQFNSYAFSVVEGTITVNVTVRNPAAAESNVWPHKIVGDAEFCHD